MALDPACGGCRHTGRLGGEGGGSARPLRGHGSGTRVPDLVSRDADRHRRGLLARATSMATLSARLAPIAGTRHGPSRRPARPSRQRSAWPKAPGEQGTGGPTHALKRWSGRATSTPARPRVGRVDRVARLAGTWWPDPAWTRPDSPLDVGRGTSLGATRAPVAALGAASPEHGRLAAWASATAGRTWRGYGRIRPVVGARLHGAAAGCNNGLDEWHEPRP
jgi:hypothetical protein